MLYVLIEYTLIFFCVKINVILLQVDGGLDENSKRTPKPPPPPPSLDSRHPSPDPTAVLFQGCSYGQCPPPAGTCASNAHSGPRDDQQSCKREREGGKERDGGRVRARESKREQERARESKREQERARESKREQERARESKREQERARERRIGWGREGEQEWEREHESKNESETQNKPARWREIKRGRAGERTKEIFRSKWKPVGNPSSAPLLLAKAAVPVDELFQARPPLLNEGVLEDALIAPERELSLQGFARQRGHHNLPEDNTPFSLTLSVLTPSATRTGLAMQHKGIYMNYVQSIRHNVLYIDMSRLSQAPTATDGYSHYTQPSGGGLLRPERRLHSIAAYLAVPLQLVLQPLEIAVPSPHTRLLQLKDGKVGLRVKKKTHASAFPSWFQALKRPAERSQGAATQDAAARLVSSVETFTISVIQ